MDKIERLERLSKLLDDGKISADEYESLKQQVLEESAPTSEQSDTPPPTQSPPQQEAPERQTTPGLYWAALVFGVGIASALLAWALLGGTDVEWSSNDLIAVVGYCQDKDASDSCGGLANALNINGCTVTEAYRYLDREAVARVNGPPPAGAGPFMTLLHTPQGVAGAIVRCETSAGIRDSGGVGRC